VLTYSAQNNLFHITRFRR